MPPLLPSEIEVLEGFPGLLTNPGEMREGWRGFLRRRSSEGRVVGVEVVFKLPVEIEVEEIGLSESGYPVSRKRVTLSDCRQKITFEALGLAVPKYRKQVTFVLEKPGGGWAFRSFAFLSPLHVRLLEKVKEVSKDYGDRFCITKSELDRVTSEIRARSGDSRPMTDGPRRWRELRNEYGFNVTVEGDLYCLYPAGESPFLVPVQEPNVRPDTGELTKDFLREKAPPFFCAKCGSRVTFKEDEDFFAAVVDHRRPVLYGGTDELSNLQVLCVRCNNVKRGYCEKCPIGYRCSVCSWAFPERFTDTLVVSLGPVEAEKFAALLEKYNKKPPELAKELLLEAVENRLRQQGV